MRLSLGPTIGICMTTSVTEESMVSVGNFDRPWAETGVSGGWFLPLPLS